MARVGRGREGPGLACGHFLAEELPDETAAEITSFMLD